MFIKVFSGEDGGGVARTGQNQTLPDIGVTQITYGGDDEEDRLKAELSERELRTGTPNMNAGEVFTCQRVAGRASTPGQRGTDGEMLNAEC